MLAERMGMEKKTSIDFLYAVKIVTETNPQQTKQAKNYNKLPFPVRSSAGTTTVRKRAILVVGTTFSGRNGQSDARPSRGIALGLL